MKVVIIRKKDLINLGKETLKEVFDLFHDEYYLSTFEDTDIHKEKEKFIKGLILYHIITLERQFKITKEKRQELYKSLESMKDDEKEKLKEDAMKDEGIDTEGIYNTLIHIKLDMEINEDISFKTKAFLDIFRVFNSGYTYLED